MKNSANEEKQTIGIQCRIINVTPKGYLMVPELLNGRPHRFIPGPALPKPAVEMKLATEEDEMQRQIRLNTLTDDDFLNSGLDDIENNHELAERTKKSRISDLYFIYLAKSSRFLLKDPEGLLPFHSISVLYELEVSEHHFTRRGVPVSSEKKFIPIYKLERLIGYQKEGKITRTFLVRMLAITGEYPSRRSLLSSIQKFDGPLYDEKQLKELLDGKSKKIMSHYHALFSDHFINESAVSLVPLYSLEQLMCLVPQQKALVNRLFNDEEKANAFPSSVSSTYMWYKIYAGYVCRRLPDKESSKERNGLSLTGSEVERLFPSSESGCKEDITFRMLFCKALWTLPSVRSPKRLALFFAKDEEEVEKKWLNPFEKWSNMLKEGNALMEVESTTDNPAEEAPHVFKFIKEKGKVVVSGHVAVRTALSRVLKHGKGSLRQCILVEGVDHNLEKLNRMVDELNNNTKAMNENPKGLWSNGVFCLCRSFNESKRVSSLTGLKSFPFWTVIDVWNSDTQGNPQHFKHVIKGHTFIVFGWTRWQMIHLLHLIKVFTYYGTLKTIWFVDPSERDYSSGGGDARDEIGILELNREFLRSRCSNVFDTSLQYNNVPSILRFSRADELTVYHEHTADFPEKMKSLLKYHFDSGETTMAEFGVYCIGKKRVDVVRSVLNSIFSELKMIFKRKRYVCLRGEHFPFGKNFFVVGDRVKTPFSQEIGHIVSLSDRKGVAVETVQYFSCENMEKRISKCGRYYQEGGEHNDTRTSPYRPRVMENKFYITTSVEPFEDHKDCCGTNKKFTRIIGGHVGRYTNADVIPLPSLFDHSGESFHGIPEANINVLFCGDDIPSSTVVEMLERKTKEVFMVFKDRNMNGENQNKKAK